MGNRQIAWPMELQKWVVQQPQSIQRIALRVHPLGVYNIKGIELGIYGRVTSYGEASEEDGEGTASLMCFDRELMGPRFGLYGVHPEDLTLIGEVDAVTGMMSFYEQPSTHQ